MRLSFFQLQTPEGRETVFAVEHQAELQASHVEALEWLFGGATLVQDLSLLSGYYIGPRAEMVTPWSTNATEITANMGIRESLGISRIEMLVGVAEDTKYDVMLLRKYHGLDAHLFGIVGEKAPVRPIKDIQQYNIDEGLALSEEEVAYLEEVAQELGRDLTDAELFGFSQVNSEHCRHKIFGGTFVIDGVEQEKSLFQMIKETSREHPNQLLSAYKDNVAFNQGSEVEIFAPQEADKPSFYGIRKATSALSLKAETHNFPTTVEPFNGAATGTGGEIRDRLAGGRASLPLAGTAVYMTPYSRLRNEPWERGITARQWLYQAPQELLTKASNGASDFGNKFGQPLINGSLLTFEHAEEGKVWSFDKVIMLAGGVGYTTEDNALKEQAEQGEKIVVLGGDNYRIGMGGGAVSSVNTGQMADEIELNAIQRSNPEMQKRVANVIRAMAEAEYNPITSIHDHGAGGHLNCLSELVEDLGGTIQMDQLPIGDQTLSAKEIISNESQERMGLLLHEQDLSSLQAIAEREMAPCYVVGEADGSHELRFVEPDGSKPFDLQLKHLFGSAPKTIIEDKTVPVSYAEPSVELLESGRLEEQIKAVLRLEAVGSKDWLTNKVDRSVTGKVARQQVQGLYQVPISDCGVVSLDYRGTVAVASSIGHAPQAGMIDAAKGVRLAIAEALTNIIGVPLKDGLSSVSLSANWMWPCKNAGEDARLYEAVQACRHLAIELGINIPTGKDSLSMTQKYPEGEKVLAPGTVIISASGEVSDARHLIPNYLQHSNQGSRLLYIDCSKGSRAALGGSAFYQSLGYLGSEAPDLPDAAYFKQVFGAIQALIKADMILSLHDISAGGLITAVSEMLFPQEGLGATVSLLEGFSLYEQLFSEKPGLLLQVSSDEAVAQVDSILSRVGVVARWIGEVESMSSRQLTILYGEEQYPLCVDELFEAWSSPSDALEAFQTLDATSLEARRANRLKQPLQWHLPDGERKLDWRDIQARQAKGVTAAIIRDKGTNGEREMAYALYLAGFNVKDVHMSDLMSGRETLEEVSLIVFCGGFSHSDVLGSAKGWAAGFRYNEKARQALQRFYERPDTLSLGICNGCQLMAELELLYPEHKKKHRMRHNQSGKFESAFVSLTIPETSNSIFLQSLRGSTLGCWVAHGEGRFDLPEALDQYQVATHYTYKEYPGNPNGSPEGIVALSSADGRHLAMMPHPERSIFPWQCAYYPSEHQQDDVTPWLSLFEDAYEWLVKRVGEQKE